MENKIILMIKIVFCTNKNGNNIISEVGRNLGDYLPPTFYFTNEETDI